MLQTCRYIKRRKSDQACLFPCLNKDLNKLMLKAKNYNLSEYEMCAARLPQKLAQMQSEFDLTENRTGWLYEGMAD